MSRPPRMPKVIPRLRISTACATGWKPTDRNRETAAPRRCAPTIQGYHVAATAPANGTPPSRAGGVHPRVHRFRLSQALSCV